MKKLKILFVSSECSPFAKTGGLGDVVGALPKILRRLGHDVRILIPLYASINSKQFNIQFETPACIHMGRKEEQWVGIHSGTLDHEVPVWFLDYQKFFGRSGIYQNESGGYSDNAFRFALLSKAALQICKDRNFIPDIFHCHDWCTALVPAFLKTWDRILSPLSKSASVLTIHNIGYQGVFDASVLPYLELGAEHYHSDCLESYGGVNLLKAGIAFADAITTVSPTHATEILQPLGGCGLAPYLQNRKADVFGILNGVDYDHWDPKTDRLLPHRYSPSQMKGKMACKAKLQKRMSLDAQAEVPIFGIVSRFATQKGFDLLEEALPPALRSMSFQIAAIGSGDRHTEDFFKSLAIRYPGRVACQIGFSNELSHWIEAGSDFFLMPSLYEPCGLSQMYSLKYGTLPLVRATGGLEDTVENYDEKTGTGTGFKFLQPTPRALYDTIGWAVSTWYDRPQHYQKLQQQAMQKEFRWEDSAQKYLEVYEHAMNTKSLP